MLCSPRAVLPQVCGSDGVSYFSPCFAGCNATGTPGDPAAPDTFHACSCITSGPQPATATAGYCTDSVCNKLPLASAVMIIAITLVRLVNYVSCRLDKGANSLSPLFSHAQVHLVSLGRLVFVVYRTSTKERVS